MSRRKDSVNNIQSRRTKTPTALIIRSAAHSIVAFRLSSKNRPQRYRSYGSRRGLRVTGAGQTLLSTVDQHFVSIIPPPQKERLVKPLFLLTPTRSLN